MVCAWIAVGFRLVAWVYGSVVSLVVSGLLIDLAVLYVCVLFMMMRVFVVNSGERV